MSECNIIKIKMCRNLSNANLETYKLNIAMFEHGQPEEFLMLMKNFKNAVDGTEIKLETRMINYLHTLFHGEALWKFDKLVIQNTGTSNAHLKFIQEGLLGYLPWLTPFPSRSAWCTMQCVNLAKSFSKYFPPVSWNSKTTSLSLLQEDIPRRTQYESCTCRSK